MKYIGKLLGWILLGVNGIVVLLLLLSAYSPYLNPQTFPHLSCAGLFFPIFLLANLLFLCFWLVVYRKYALFPLLKRNRKKQSKFFLITPWLLEKGLLIPRKSRIRY